ncbi:MAG: hypothetical protein Q8J97_13435 [Flavobacteriaceae bacterium]|nr:hypothetical protein [Flavobacteriaceae bacterium]
MWRIPRLLRVPRLLRLISELLLGVASLLRVPRLLLRIAKLLRVPLRRHLWRVHWLCLLGITGLLRLRVSRLLRCEAGLGRITKLLLRVPRLRLLRIASLLLWVTRLRLLVSGLRRKAGLLLLRVSVLLWREAGLLLVAREWLLLIAWLRLEPVRRRYKA